MIEFRFLDQTLHLYPQRAVYWVEGKTAVVADLHFGKAATFRAHGIAMPAGTTEANLARLTAVLTHTSAERLIMLGDLLHAKAGRDEVMVNQVTAWRQQFATLAIDLAIGNHDRQAGSPPDGWRMREVERLVERPFVWQHEPGESADGYVLAGHVHPAVQLRGPGERISLPCFYFGHHFGLLPAFGEFTGFGRVHPRPGDAVFVLADQEIIRLDNSSKPS